LNRLAEELILKAGALPAFKGYGGFPAALCVSINEVVVHGVPSERKLAEGDIVSLDCGILYKDFYSDMAVTLPVGKVSPEAQRLMRVCKKALKLGIKQSKTGSTFGDIGNTIQRYVEYQNYETVRDLCGHGIGKKLHEDPNVLNFGKRHTGPKIEEGMVFCIEPMITEGGWEVALMKDRFGYRTKDGKLSAHWEAMVAVTKKGPKVLTRF